MYRAIMNYAKFGRMLLLFAIFLFVSCSECDDALESSTDETLGVSSPSNYQNFLKVSDKESLKNLILSGNSTCTRSVEEQEYVSLMDVVRSDDPIFQQFSKEEQDYVKENELTYYDVLGFDDIVPNENFARLLNSRGEIQVRDSVYRITAYGTLATNMEHEKDLDVAVRLLEDGNFDESKVPSVKVIGSYTNVEMKKIGDKETRTPIESIPYEKFPSYSSESHTVAGYLIGKLFGDRSVKHHDFMKGYRIKGSLYDYDYGVYSEIGAFVASRKKRGGFFKKINGWKGTRAQELTIVYRGVVLELDTKLPNHLEFPKTTTILSENVSMEIPGVGNKIHCVDICGKEITEGQIMALAGKGLNFGLSKLNEYVDKKKKKKIKNDTRAVRILTPTKVYVVILDNQINEYNVEQVRKVFNSSVKFFVSSSMLSNPISAKAAYDFMRGLDELPVKKMKGGQVILAGKINNTWGGMKISKKE